MRKQLPHYRETFKQPVIQYCDADVELLQPILDAAVKNHINIRGRRSYTVLVDVNDNPVRILTDVVVICNFASS